MFRNHPLPVLLIALASCAAGRFLAAQELQSLETYREMLATGVDPAADTRKLARSLADRWAEDGPRSWYFVDGRLDDAAFDEPAFALIAGFPGDGDGRVEAMALTLTTLEALVLDRPAHDMAMLMYDEAIEPAAVPASSAELLDPGSTAVIVLLHGERGATARAGASGMLSPRPLLEAARESFRAAGADLRESPVEDFLARIALIPGSPRLGPWLEAGYAAIALAGPPAALAALVSGDRLQGTRAQDVNYFRYPVPGARLTLGDSTIVLGGCLAGTILALYALFHAKRRESFVEALLAFFLVLLALYAGQGLSWAFLRLASLLPVAAPDSEAGPVALAFRAIGVVAWYYAVSGLAARLGLSLKSARISAMHAGAALFVAAALAGLAVAPVVIPFSCLFAFLILAGGRTMATAGMALAAALAIASPFVWPMFSGAYPDTIRALLHPTPVLALTLALAISPFTLWIGAAVSPGSTLRRGRRPAFLFIAASVACALAEAGLAWLPGA